MTTSRHSPTRCFYHLKDRRTQVLDLTPVSLAVVNERYRCTGHLCPYLSPRWHEHPEGIDVVVEKYDSRAWVETIARFSLRALDVYLSDVLAPYCRDIFFGKVYVDAGTDTTETTRFVTVAAPASRRIQSDRGRYCRHMPVQFECCGVFTSNIGWASGAIVERTLDDRLVYVDQDGHVLVADELVEKLELRKRFPQLWLYRVDVVPEPLDSEVLPGDRGWDGVFRPAEPPVLPEAKPKPGRVTYD